MVRGIGRMVVAAAVLGMSAVSALGRQSDPGKTAPRRVEAPAFAVSVEFNSGTVADYVNVLKEACKPHPVNVVVSDAALHEELSRISLKSVSLAAALQAIPAASGSPDGGAWLISRLPDSVPGEAEASGAADTTPAYQVVRRASRGGPPPGETTMEVISLGRIVGGGAAGGDEQRTAAVLTAADTALRMGVHRTPPEMKFHKESGLLIIRGEVEDVRAVQEVVRKMTDDAARVQEEQATRESVRRQMEFNVARAEVQLKQAQSQLEFSKTKLAQIEQLVAKGSVPTTEAMEARERVEHDSAQVEMARIELDSAQEMLKRGVMVPPGGGGGGGAARPGRGRNVDPVRGEAGGGGGAGGAGDPAAMVQQLRDENMALRDQLEEVTKKVVAMQAAMDRQQKANNPGKQ